MEIIAVGCLIYIVYAYFDNRRRGQFAEYVTAQLKPLGVHHYETQKIGYSVQSTQTVSQSLLFHHYRINKIPEGFRGNYKNEDYAGYLIDGMSLYDQHKEQQLHGPQAKEQNMALPERAYYIQFTLKNVYQSRTVILPEKVKFIGEKTLGDLKRANFVYPSFEGRFDVFTADQVEARFIVDHVMMEKLLSILGAFPVSYFSFSVWENKLAFLIVFQSQLTGEASETISRLHNDILYLYQIRDLVDIH